MHPSLCGLSPRSALGAGMAPRSLRAISPGAALRRVQEYAARSAMDGTVTVTVARVRRKVRVESWFDGRSRSVWVACATEDDARRVWDALAHRASPDTLHALAWAAQSSENRSTSHEQ